MNDIITQSTSVSPVYSCSTVSVTSDTIGINYIGSVTSKSIGGVTSRDVYIDYTESDKASSVHKRHRCVDPCVKNTLNKTKDMITASTYSDGYLETTKNIIPTIKNIKLIKDKYGDMVGIIMYFADGTYEKAICHQDDADMCCVFDFEKSFMLCMFKKMIGLGDNNTAIVNKMIRYADKFLDNQLAEEFKKEQYIARSKEITERRRAKRKRKRDRKKKEFIDSLASSISAIHK